MKEEQGTGKAWVMGYGMEKAQFVESGFDYLENEDLQRMLTLKRRGVCGQTTPFWHWLSFSGWNPWR